MANRNKQISAKAAWAHVSRLLHTFRAALEEIWLIASSNRGEAEERLRRIRQVAEDTLKEDKDSKAA